MERKPPGGEPNGPLSPPSVLVCCRVTDFNFLSHFFVQIIKKNQKKLQNAPKRLLFFGICQIIQEKIRQFFRIICIHFWRWDSLFQVSVAQLCEITSKHMQGAKACDGNGPKTRGSQIKGMNRIKKHLLHGMEKTRSCRGVAVPGGVVVEALVNWPQPPPPPTQLRYAQKIQSQKIFLQLSKNLSFHFGLQHHKLLSSKNFGSRPQNFGPPTRKIWPQSGNVGTTKKKGAATNNL